MSDVLWILGGLVLALHLLREYWLRRNLPQVQTATFDGELYRVGQTYIARRPATTQSRKSIVCFPGFLEDMRYFQALYAGADCELVLVNNANYHCAYPTDNARELDWPDNPHPPGSIEHDAFYLGLILRELVTGTEIILHGHSRGGAVVLETGHQYPDLVRGADRQVAAILEAPVLPGARTVGRGSEPIPFRLICYFMPLVLGLSRRLPPEKLLDQPMMRPSNDLKLAVCSAIYTNPRNYSTCIANVRSIRNWQRAQAYDRYANYERITVVIGERDDVLDNPSMLASAERGRALNDGVAILQTEGTNHFPSLEKPAYLTELARV